jgi:LacI family transcriptional regulator
LCVNELFGVESLLENKSVTINDVARIAGVSKRTVSRVINSSPAVNEATRVKVQSVIDQLEFKPSTMARGLASNRSFLIGLLFDDLNAAVLHPVLRGVLTACSERGFDMVLKPLETQLDNLSEQVAFLIKNSRVEGFVLLPPLANNTQLIQALANKNVPYVRLGAKLADDPRRMVISDDRTSMRKVIELFLNRDAQKLAIVKGPANRVAAEERYEGFIQAASEHGILAADIDEAQGDFTYESGLGCAKQLLSTSPRPDAIFACNDQMAIGVMHMAAEMGIEVPRELLVVGYDNDPASAFMRPSLTTFARPSEEMAFAAVTRLIDRLSGESSHDNNQLLAFTPSLIERQSTARN